MKNASIVLFGDSYTAGRIPHTQPRLPLSRLGIRAANELESITPPQGWK